MSVQHDGEVASPDSYGSFANGAAAGDDRIAAAATPTNDDEAGESNDDETTSLVRLERKGTLVSPTNTLMNFLRAEISAGCLSLAIAFKYSGLWLGLALSPVIGILNTICSLNLVETSQHLCKKTGRAELDYGHLAKKVFDLGPEPLRKHSKKALYVCNVCVSLYQIGVATVQAVFIAVNIINFLCFIHAPWIPTTHEMLAMLLPMFFLLNSIPSLHVLAYFSTVGNVIICVGFAIVFAFILTPPNVVNSLPAVGKPLDIALYAGSMLYAYEGQAVILPMENKMKDPRAMVGWNGVLVTGMGILTAVYTATGFFGYCKYGEGTLETLTLNMPPTAALQAVNVCLIVAVILGWPLQLYVIVEMLWPPTLRKYVSRTPARCHTFLVYAFRHSLVLVVFLIGMVVPYLDLLVPLVGITVGVVLAFIFPPILQLIAYWEDWTPRQRRWYTVRNVLVVVGGVIAMGIGTYATLLAVVKSIETPRPEQSTCPN